MRKNNLFIKGLLRNAQIRVILSVARRAKRRISTLMRSFGRPWASLRMTKVAFRNSPIKVVPVAIFFLFFGLKSVSSGGQSKELPSTRINQVKVACLYENITDGVALGRSIEETIALLKETRADFILRGFWKWMPVLNSCDDIPLGLLELAESKNLSLKQISQELRKNGHYYQELEK